MNEWQNFLLILLLWNKNIKCLVIGHRQNKIFSRTKSKHFSVLGVHWSAVEFPIWKWSSMNFTVLEKPSGLFSQLFAFRNVRSLLYVLKSCYANEASDSVKQATKTCSLFSKISAKWVKERCCTFCHPRSTLLATIITIIIMFISYIAQSSMR